MIIVMDGTPYIFEVSLSGTGVPAHITISPSSYNYGEVQVGNSVEQFFTVTSYITVHNISDIYLEGSSDFTVTTPPANTILPPETSTDIGVSYAPSDLGPDQGTLFVIVINLGTTTLEVDLSGTGVSVAPPPGEQIAEILDFIDTSVQGGALAGEGPGESAGGRLGALINMIEAAGDLINQGDYQQACQQLQDANERCDDDFPPPDFVAGTAREELAQMILNLRADLECNDM